MRETALEKYFDNLQVLKQSFFPDLFFRSTQAGHPLSIKVDLECQFLRFRLPAGQSLQLEKVLVYALVDDSEVNIAPESEISVSSLLSGSDKLLAKRCLVNLDHEGLGIHTDNTGQDEWITLDFGQTYQLKQIVVSNISSVWAWRAWKLIIESSSNSELWQVQYDHYARLMLLSECVAGYDSGKLQLPEKLQVICSKIMTKLCQRQYGKARQLLDESVKTGDIFKDESATIRAGFSRLVLQNEQLAWSGHGILRPFVFWGDLEKQRYLEQANSVISTLQSISPYVCFGFGMVLGNVRDGDLIPHDDDVDIIIGFDRSVAHALPDALRLVSDTLQAAGYVVGGEHLFSHRWVKVPGGKNFDVFVGLCDDEYISWYPSARNGFLVKEVFPPLTVPFHGVDCPVPKSPVHYLDVTYGKQWRSPDPDFHHPWDMASYSDLNK